MNVKGTMRSIQSMHEAVDKEIKEEFKCPICMECYMSDIYQCVHGHSICDNCINIVPNGQCPRCRVPYEKGKVRNRSLEAVRDQMPFPCRFRANGCKEQVPFTQMAAHARFCGFGSILPLCNQVGFDKCDFLVNPYDMWQAIDHFQRQHAGVKVNGPHFDAYFRDVKSCQKGNHFIWNPIIITLQEDAAYLCNYAFILFCVFDGVDSTMAWKCLHLHHDIKAAPKYFVNLKIDSFEFGELTWRMPVISILRDELILKSTLCKAQHSLLKGNFLSTKAHTENDLLEKEINGLHVQMTIGSDVVDKHSIKPGETRLDDVVVAWVDRQDIKIEQKKNRLRKLIIVQNFLR